MVNTHKKFISIRELEKDPDFILVLNQNVTSEMNNNYFDLQHS